METREIEVENLLEIAKSSRGSLEVMIRKLRDNSNIDYNLSLNFSYGYSYFRIIISHNKFNWTSFAEVSFQLKDSFMNDNNSFDFQNGTQGSFNSDVSVKDRLNTIIQIMQLIQIIEKNKNIIFDKFKEVNIKIQEFSRKRDELNELKDKLSIEETIKKTIATKLFSKIDDKIIKDITSPFLKDIDNNNNTLKSKEYKLVKINPSQNKTQEIIIQKKLINNRMNFFLNGFKFTKKDLISHLKTHNDRLLIKID